MPEDAGRHEVQEGAQEVATDQELAQQQQYEEYNVPQGHPDEQFGLPPDQQQMQEQQEMQMQADQYAHEQSQRMQPEPFMTK